MRRGLRVIAGQLRGRRFCAPDSARPTADRVREAIFSAIGDAVVGGTVLDAYAGSAAFAIESCSRGASAAVAVERDAAAARVATANVADLGLAGAVRVVRRDVASFVAGSPPAEAPFGVAFLDPPYDLPTADVEGVLEALAGSGWLAPGATVVVERSARDGAPELPAGWGVHWVRTYGDTLVVLATA